MTRSRRPPSALNMPILSRISWPRVFAESAIIVTSILLAFWLEAWWSDRQAGDEERAILVPLRAELGQVVQQSTLIKSAAQGIFDSTVMLVNYSLRGNVPDHNDELHRLISDFSYRINSKFTAAPVLESLFFTGDLEVISNSDLRREISEFRIQLDWLRAEIERDSEYFNKSVIPYLQQTADLAPFYTNDSYAPGFWGNKDYMYSYPGLDASPITSHAAILELRVFRNMLLHRLTTLGNTLWQWDESELEERLARIEVLIDQDWITLRRTSGQYRAKSCSWPEAANRLA